MSDEKAAQKIVLDQQARAMRQQALIAAMNRAAPSDTLEDITKKAETLYAWMVQGTDLAEIEG